MTLYDLAGAEDDRRFSPYCWRAKMALKHKGLEFETVPWRFTEKDAIAFSGSKTVPVIRDGSTVVADSWNIAVYLDQAYPSRPGLMDGAAMVALTDFFQQWTIRSPQLALFKVILLDIFERIHEKDKAYFRESREKRFGMRLEEWAGDPKQALAAFRGALEPVRPVLVQNRFVSGHGPGYADYVLLGMFQWARCVSPTRLLEPDDPVYAWRERVLDLFDGYARAAKGYPVWA
ncbi:MAG: glutathione S-transferase family protein [Betaproteobacteria bacterium]|nr:glutathione S-transferase family protein [Betaproteobacteria bacterium]